MYKGERTRCTLPILPIFPGFSLWAENFTTSAPTKPHVLRYVPIRKGLKDSVGEKPVYRKPHAGLLPV